MLMINLQAIFTIGKKEVLYLFREKTFFVLLGIFIVMAILSTLIGWATIHTIHNVYDAAANELIAMNQPVPPFPVKISSLSIIKNMIIYVVLIGSLLSIILGYFVGINDRISGTVKLIFSRNIRKTDLLLGKILAIAKILILILLSSFVISLVSAQIFHVMSIENLLRITEFYSISFLYMFGFALLALALAVTMKSSASAILYALFFWILITFALPEIGSALYPTASLNPVLPPTDVLQSPILQNIHQVFYPISISEHYKELGASFLGIANPSMDGAISYSNHLHLFILLFWVLGTLGFAFLFFQNINPSQNSLNE